jgi:hypothetical protein
MHYGCGMSVAQAAPPHVKVLFRHRRRPPALHVGVIGAIFVGVSAFAMSSHVWQAVAVLAALALIALGWLGRERLWIEDQLITPTSAVIVHPDGDTFSLDFNSMARVAERRNAIAFIRDDGAELQFNRNPHVKKIKRVLAEAAPGLSWVDEVDLACDT